MTPDLRLVAWQTTTHLLASVLMMRRNITASDEWECVVDSALDAYRALLKMDADHIPPPGPSDNIGTQW